MFYFPVVLVIDEILAALTGRLKLDVLYDLQFLGCFDLQLETILYAVKPYNSDCM